MLPNHPHTSANLPRALIGLTTLELKLLQSGLISFRWPQDVDSGIDLVSFVVSTDPNSPNTPLATSFVAGFQSKSTARSFRSIVTSSLEKQEVEVGKHRHYWKHASMPVFIAAIDGDGVVLVEDAGAYLHINPDATEIEVVRPLETVISDIRLRMFAHALAPGMSPGLRDVNSAPGAPVTYGVGPPGKAIHR